jgi:hypothetical protein
MHKIFCLFGITALGVLPWHLQGQIAGEEAMEVEEELDEEGKRKPPKIIAPEKTDETSAKIIELHLKGRGGIEAIRAVTALKIKGTLREGRNRYKMTWYRETPNKYRIERKFHRMGKSHIFVWAFDGTTAWSQDASPEREDPQVMSKSESAAFAREADFHGPLVDWKEKGHKFLYVGEEVLGERKVYTLKTFLKDGPVVYHYFDTRNFLVPRYGFEENLGGALVNADYYVTKFRRHGGILMDEGREYTAGRDGGVYKEITYETIDINPSLPGDLWVMPAVKEFWMRQKDR